MGYQSKYSLWLLHTIWYNDMLESMTLDKAPILSPESSNFSLNLTINMYKITLGARLFIWPTVWITSNGHLGNYDSFFLNFFYWFENYKWLGYVRFFFSNLKVNDKLPRGSKKHLDIVNEVNSSRYCFGRVSC